MPGRSIYNQIKHRLPKGSKPAGEHKMGAKRTGGFGSQGEYECHEWLKLREKAGEIRIVRLQPVVLLDELCPHCLKAIGKKFSYTADFHVFEIKENRDVWIDYKGLVTNRYLHAKTLWRVGGPGLFQEIRGDDRWQMRVTEEIIPIPMEALFDAKRRAVEIRRELGGKG